MICEADVGRSEGIVEPFAEVAIGEQVEADHGDEIRQGPSPSRAKLKESEDEDGDQSGPDLDVEGVFGSADEGLDTRVLFDGSEEQFRLPALPIDLGNGCGSQVEPVGEEDVRFAVVGDEFDSAKADWLLVDWPLFGFERDDLVPNHSLALCRPLLDHLIDAVPSHARDEADAEQGQLGKPEIVVVSAVEHHDGPRWKL